jgi:hypothetical protein
MLSPTPRASGGQAQMPIGWLSSSRRIRSFRSLPSRERLLEGGDDGVL